MRPSDIVFPDGGRPMVYLASPYAHSDKDVCKSRYWAAVKALAEAMQGQKVTVFSPIAHNHPSAVRFDLPKDWAFWRAVDFPFLEMCDMLVVLEARRMGGQPGHQRRDHPRPRAGYPRRIRQARERHGVLPVIEPIDGTEGMSENFRRMLPWLLVGGVVMWMVIAFTVTHLFIFAEEVRYDWGTDDLTRAVDRLNNEPMMYHPKACWRICSTSWRTSRRSM